MNYDYIIHYFGKLSSKIRRQDLGTTAATWALLLPRLSRNLDRPERIAILSIESPCGFGELQVDLLENFVRDGTIARDLDLQRSALGLEIAREFHLDVAPQFRETRASLREDSLERAMARFDHSCVHELDHRHHSPPSLFTGINNIITNKKSVKSNKK